MNKQDIKSHIDACCDSFEAEFRNEKYPCMDGYLELIELQHRPELLRELFCLESELIGPAHFAANF